MEKNYCEESKRYSTNCKKTTLHKIMHSELLQC